MNIIVKGKTPSWRPNQSKLGHFSSLHKDDSKIVDSSLPVEKQFDSLELIRIANACHATNTMNLNMNNEDETEEGMNELKRQLIEKGKKV